jgi:hypothetical protein
MTNLSVEFWRSEQELFDNQDIWDEIFLSSRASAYLSFEWISTRWKHYNKARSPLIGLVRDDAEPVAIVPLWIVNERIGPVPCKTLCYMLGIHGMEVGPLVKDGYSALHMLDTVILASHSTGHRWDYARLDRFPAPKLSTSLPDDNAGTGLQRIARKTEVGRITEIPASWDEFKKTLSPKHRQNVSRHVRNMERSGRVRYEQLGLTPLDDSPGLRSLMKDALTVSRQSWQHKSESGGAISKPNNSGFFQEVSLMLARRGMLDLSVLYLDDRPISFNWGAARRPYTSIYRPGFDEAFADLAPGVVHLAKHVEDCIKSGFVEIDQGPDFFDFKLSWCKKHVDLCTLYYYPKGLKPTLLRLLRSKLHARDIIAPASAPASDPARGGEQ